MNVFLRDLAIQPLSDKTKTVNSELYAILKPYDEQVMRWLTLHDDNKRKFFDNPLDCILEITDDASLVEKIKSVVKKTQIPFDIGNVQNEVHYLPNTAQRTMKSIVPPENDFCFKWDILASSTADVVNDAISATYGEKEITYAWMDLGDYKINMKLGAGKIHDAQESVLILRFPVLEGELHYRQLGSGWIDCDITGTALLASISLKEVLVTEKTTSNAEERTYTYLIDFAGPNGSTIQSVKFEPSDILATVPDKIIAGAVSMIPVILQTILEKNGGSIPIYTITVTDEDKNSLISNHEYLFPTYGKFTAIKSHENDAICLSVLMNSIHNSGEYTTSTDTLPDNANVALNINNSIFVSEILTGVLSSALNALDRDKNNLDKSSFEVSGSHYHIIQSKPGVRANVKIDNCPDAEITSVQLAINNQERLVLQADLYANLDCFYEVTGNMYYEMKFEVRDCGNTQTVALVGIGEPTVEFDVAWDWVAILLSVLTLGFGAIVFAIVQAIIDGLLNNIDFSSMLNTNDLLNGKFSWDASDIIKMTTIKPMGCLQIGFEATPKII